MIANNKYKSELRRLNEDIAKKIKEEQMRSAYDQSSASFEAFKNLLAESRIFGSSPMSMSNESKQSPRVSNINSNSQTFLSNSGSNGDLPF